MSDAALIVQQAAVAALQAHPALAAVINGVFDGPPERAAFPFVSIEGGAASDWSTKTAVGREVRLALTLWDDGEEPTRLHVLMAHAEDALAALPRDLASWRVVSNVFLRSFVARNAAGPWSGLVEQRVRVIEA